MEPTTVNTTKAKELLAKRGINVAYPTVALWVRSGLFAGARLVPDERGGQVWKIPIESIENFVRPRRGQPPKPTTQTQSSSSAKSPRRRLKTAA